jgi:hypothetical protein
LFVLWCLIFARALIQSFANFCTAVVAYNVVDIFDSSSNLWTTAALSVARTDLTAGSVGNLAMFAGGELPSALLASISCSSTHTSFLDFATGRVYNVVDVYNSVLQKWTTAQLSVARSWFVAASCQNTVIFSGGQSASSMLLLVVWL